MRKILVIDDDDLSRALYRTVLEQKGYAVEEASGGEDGVSLFRSDGADLVITDIFMEDKDGLEVIDDLRSIDENTKIVAISGVGGGAPGAPDYLAMAQASGAQAVLRKPIDWKQMVAVISRMLGNGSSASP